MTKLVTEELAEKESLNKAEKVLSLDHLRGRNIHNPVAQGQRPGHICV
jgi:hypothetical protein